MSLEYIYRADGEQFRVYSVKPNWRPNEKAEAANQLDTVVPGYNHHIVYEHKRDSRSQITIDSIIGNLTQSLRFKNETDEWLAEHHVDYREHAAIRRIWAFRTEVDAIHFKLRFS